MTNFLQDTDSQSWDEGESSSSLSDVTLGIEGQPDAFKLRRESNPVKQAREVIPQIENADVAKQLDSLLLIINAIVNVIDQKRMDLNCIPPLHAYVEDDGAVSVEWIFPDFRIGFNIEPNPDDSGWHLVAGKSLGDKTESGQLMDMPNIVSRLFSFILSNI